MKKNRYLVGVCLVIGLAMLLTQGVLAYNGIAKSNFGGITTALAEKYAQYVNRSTWNAQVKSSTYNPTRNIARIGWTWWTFRELCNGIIISDWPQPGHVYYNASSISDTGVDAIDSCPAGNHWGYDLGVHDFAQGSSVWQPSLIDTVKLP